MKIFRSKEGVKHFYAAFLLIIKEKAKHAFFIFMNEAGFYFRFLFLELKLLRCLLTFLLKQIK